MPNVVHCNITASVTELKTNPMATVSAGDGYPVVILNRNQPSFYCIPAELFEAMSKYVNIPELVETIKKTNAEKS